MARSEKAKELAAKQKAAIRAEKLRKKTSDNPRDWGWYRQLREAYRRTAEVDPKVTLWMGLAAAGAIVLVVAIGLLTRTAWWAWAPLAILLALTAGLLVLTNRAKKAMITRYQGQPGSAEVVLQLLPNKKYSYELAIAATRQLDLVHRVVGPGGILLIGEGQPGRARPLLAGEARRHEHVAFGVPVTTIMLGDAPNQVKLAGLQKHIEKMPKVLEKYQMAEVNQRLRALDAARPKAPVPKGPMPSLKGVNRALRGR